MISKLKMALGMKNLKNKDNLKNENDLKNEDNFKKYPSPQKKGTLLLNRILPEFLFMTSHLDGHGTTDTRPETLSCVQTGNGIQHDECNLCGITHVCIYKKDAIFMHRQLLPSFTYQHIIICKDYVSGSHTPCVFV